MIDARVTENVCVTVVKKEFYHQCKISSKSTYLGQAETLIVVPLVAQVTSYHVTGLLL